MLVLGIDADSHNIGWTVINEKEELISHGLSVLKGDTLVDRVMAATDATWEIVWEMWDFGKMGTNESYYNSCAGLENCYLKHNNPKTLKSLAMINGAIIAILKRFSWCEEIYLVPPHSAIKHAMPGGVDLIAVAYDRDLARASLVKRYELDDASEHTLDAIAVALAALAYHNERKDKDDGTRE